MISCITQNGYFFGAIALALVLGFIPFIRNFVNVFHTLIHESAHALVSLLTGGGVVAISLNPSTAGAAQTKSKYWMGKFLTSLAGYPGASLSAWLFFWLISQQKTDIIFFIIFSLLLINLILWVRNTFGIVWLLIFGTLCALIYVYTEPPYQFFFAVFLAALTLIQSVYSTLVLLLISFKNPSKAGDSKNLKDFTLIPAVIWTLLFFVFSVYMAFQSVLLMPCVSILCEKLR